MTEDVIGDFEREVFDLAAGEKLQFAADALRKSPLYDLFDPGMQGGIRARIRLRFGPEEFSLRQAVAHGLVTMAYGSMPLSEPGLTAGLVKGICTAVFFALIRDGAFSVRFSESGELLFTEVP